MAISEILKNIISNESTQEEQFSIFEYVNTNEELRDRVTVMESIESCIYTAQTAMEQLNSYKDKGTLTPELACVILGGVTTKLTESGMGSLLNTTAMESFDDVEVAIEGLGDTIGTLWTGLVNGIKDIYHVIRENFVQVYDLTKITTKKLQDQKQRIVENGGSMTNNTVSISRWRPLYSPAKSTVSADIKDLVEFVDQAINYSDAGKISEYVKESLKVLRDKDITPSEAMRVAKVSEAIYKHYDFVPSKATNRHSSPARAIEDYFIYQALQSKNIMLGNTIIYGVSNTSKPGFEGGGGKLFLQRLEVENLPFPKTAEREELPALSKDEMLKYNAVLSECVSKLSKALNEVKPNMASVEADLKELDKLRESGIIEKTALVTGVLATGGALLIPYVILYFLLKVTNTLEGVSISILTRALHSCEAMQDYIEANIKNYK